MASVNWRRRERGGRREGGGERGEGGTALGGEKGEGGGRERERERESIGNDHVCTVSVHNDNSVEWV